MMRVTSFLLAALALAFGLYALIAFNPRLTYCGVLYHALAFFGVGLAMVAIGCFRLQRLFLVLTGASPILLSLTWQCHVGDDVAWILYMGAGTAVVAFAFALAFSVSCVIWCMGRSARRRESVEKGVEGETGHDDAR